MPKLPVVEDFELVFPDLDVDGSRLLLNQNAVDAGPLRAERAAVLRDPCTAIPGVEDFHDRADLQRLRQILDCQFQIPPARHDQGATPMMRSNSARMMPSS